MKQTNTTDCGRQRSETFYLVLPYHYPRITSST